MARPIFHSELDLALSLPILNFIGSCRLRLVENGRTKTKAERGDGCFLGEPFDDFAGKSDTWTTSLRAKGDVKIKPLKFARLAELIAVRPEVEADTRAGTYSWPWGVVRRRLCSTVPNHAMRGILRAETFSFMAIMRSERLGAHRKSSRKVA